MWIAKDFHDSDSKYFVEKGEQGFSPARNKAIIEETIRKHEENRKRKAKEDVEKLGEVIEAVASYGTYRFNKGSLKVDQYLEKQVMTKLMGERIIERAKRAQAMKKHPNDKTLALL